MRDIRKTIQKFHDRQDAIREVAPADKSYKTVTVSLQTCHAALGACAAVLQDLQPHLQPSGSKKPTLQELEDLWGVEIRDKLVTLIESAELLAAGRDDEVRKKIGLTFLVTTAKWLAKLSPIRPDDVKDVLDAAAVVGDIVGLRKALKERKRQAAAAASVLRWSKSVTLLAMHWSMEGQRVLDLLTHQPDKTEDELVASVQQRMRAAVPSWTVERKTKTKR